MEELPVCANDDDYAAIHKFLGLSGQVAVKDPGLWAEGLDEDEEFDDEDDEDEMEF